MVNFGQFQLLAQKQLPLPLPATWQAAMHLFPEQLAHGTSIGEDVENPDPLCTTDGN